MTIWFDMDGTIASLFTVPNWLDGLQAEEVWPYLKAAPMLNMSLLARKLNKLQKAGYKLGIISWTSMNGSASYNDEVRKAKEKWLRQHLHSVEWDFIKIVEYGKDKGLVCNAQKTDMLFDDSRANRENWPGSAFHPNHIMSELHNL